MCFSATASFAASGLLIGSGIIATRISANKNEKILSQIPVVFGIQQAIEGGLWLALANGEYNLLLKSLTLAFIGIAIVVWPIFIPWVFLKFTKNPVLKKINFAILILGLIVGIFNVYSLFLLIPYPKIDGHHIAYQWYEYRNYRLFFGIAYTICTLVPVFLTNDRKLFALGIAHMIMFVFSYLFMINYLISVWCFLAAVSSIIILITIYKNNRIKSK